MGMGKVLTNWSKRECRVQQLERIERSAFGKKGQMFVIAAIFMIIGVILLRNILSFPAITQEKTFQDVSYLDRNLKNIKNEFAYTAGVASAQHRPNATGADYLLNISDYVRNQFDSKILYLYVFANGTTQNVSVTVGNYLQTNISGTIEVTDSTPPTRAFDLNDKGYITLEFNSSQSMVNLTLNYTIQDRKTVEKIYFNVSTKNYVRAFFDITLLDTGFFARSKSVYNRSW
jgi:hypothetical protein